MNAAEMQAERRLTGWHVAAMFVGGFGVIVAVNIVLAVSAVRTFPGIETESSYVASQTFDADRAAQDALGWDVEVTYGAGFLFLAIEGPDGRAVRPEIVAATLGRATNVTEDRSPDFTWDGTRLTAPADLAPG
ncbi:MAG: FixH family protein, partial [Jannaschia sp.]